MQNLRMRKILLLGSLFLLSSLASFSQQITVVQANGGEQLYACETYPITWTFSGSVSNYFDIDYSLDGGTIWASVTSSYFSSSGVFNWTVPAVQSNTVLFRVKDSQNGTIVDQSDNFFSIGISMEVTSPNGGEVFTGNTVETISWNAAGTSNSFNIYYSTNGGSSWTTIVSNYSTVSGTYDWTVPNLSSTTCKIRVSDASQSCKTDQSDANFTINPDTPELLYPNGGEVLLSSCDVTITWNTSTFYSNVRLDYSIDNGVTWNVIVTSTPNDGSHSWTNVPSGPQANCLIRASNTSNLSLNDVSDAVFSIEAPVELTTVFTDTLYGCTNYTVYFNYAKTCESAYTYCYYSIDNGTTWNLFGTHTNSSSLTYGARTFSVPNGTTSSQCKFLVSTEPLTSGTAYSDASVGTFTILPAQIDVQVTALNGGETVQPDDVVFLSWINTAGTLGLYDVYYSTNNGSSWTLIANDLNSMNYTWTVPNTPSDEGLIRVIFANQSCNFDISDANFTIGKRTPVMTYPNGGEQLLSGCPVSITWDATTYYGNVRIDYSTDNGVIWVPIVTNTTNDGIHSWAPPSGDFSDVRIKVTQTNDLTHVDECDASFAIKPPVKLTTVFTDTLYGCTNFSVFFDYTKTCVSPYTYCYYSIDNGATWTNFGTLTNSSSLTSGSRTFTVPDGITSNQCKFMVSTQDPGGYTDISSYTFTILPAQIDVTVTSPNGGESFLAESTTLVSWTNTPAVSGPYDVFYSINNGTTWSLAGSNIIGNNFNWTVPNVPSTNCLMEVRVNGQSCNKDQSNNVFTIEPKDPILLLPNGGEFFYVASTTNITWDQTTYYSNVRIEYSSDNGTTWNTIVTSTTNDGIHPWTLPNVNSTNCLVRILQTNDISRYDESDAVFTIGKQTPVLTYPNGGEQLLSSCSVNILWNQTTFYNNVKLEYSINNGTTWNTIVTSTPNVGTYSWTPPSGPLSQVKVKITEVGDPAQTDQSATVFSIKQPLELTTVFTDTLYGCTSFPVTFNYSKTCEGTGTYCYYSIDNGATWTSFGSFTNSASGTSGSRTFSVPNGITSNQCKFMVCTQPSGGYCDTSNYTFTILPAPIDVTVTYPNGGETFIIGSVETLTWTSTPYTSGIFDIYYSSNGGSSYVTLASNVSSNSYDWTIPNAPGTNYKFKVVVDGQVCNFDESNATFSIAPQPAVMTYPNGGENLLSSCSSTITWDQTTYYSNVRIDYTTDNGLTWTAITTNTANDGSHSWNPPVGPQSQMKIRVTQTNDLTRFDESNAVFSIKPPVELISVYTDTLYGCTSYPVAFNYSQTCVNAYTYCYYSIDNGATWTLFGQYTNVYNGTYGTRTFSVPDGITSNQCKFMVCSQNSGGYCDTSNYTFTILPAPINVQVTALNGGETVQPDDNVLISWNNIGGTIGLYDVYYSTNNGSTYTLIANDVNGLNYNWTVPNIPTSNAKIKVVFNNQTCNFDESDATFTITKRTPVMTYPNGGELLLSNCAATVTWDPATYYGNVRLDYSTNNGLTWITIVSSTSNNGTYNWSTVPTGPLNSLLVKVSQTNDLAHFDVSDAVFGVKEPVELVTVFTDTLYGCTSLPVYFNYSKTCVSSLTYCYYSTDNGASWISFGTYTNNSNGTYASRTFSVPDGITSSQCKFMVCTQASGGYCDTSNYTFTILPSPIDVQVTTPNGGESFQAGSTALISWTNTPAVSGPYDVYYSINNGSSWTLTGNDIIGNNYNWTIPNTPSTTCMVEVRVNGQSCNKDRSDNVFTIEPKTPLLYLPNGGETFYSGLTTNITWDPTTFYSNVRIEYSTNNGTTWNMIVSSTTNDGLHTWTIPNENSADCRVRVTQGNDFSRFDISNSTFRIKPAVTVMTPNGDNGITNWGGCTVTSITFDRSPAWNRYNILYSIDGGTNWTTIVTNWYNTSNPATYNWTMPNIPTSQALVKVEPYYEVSYYDESDATFTITKPVTLTQPNFGGIMQVGSVYNIEWNSDGISNLYDLFYSTDNGVTWNTIIIGYNTSTNTYAWTVPNVLSTQCLIRVEDNIDGCKQDISDVPFTITNVSPPITILSPNGGEVLTGCSTQTIDWSESSTFGTYDIAYSINGGASWITIENNVSTTLSSYDWNVPNIDLAGVLVRVQVSGTVTEDYSDALFEIQSNSVEITTTNQTICSGQTVQLTAVNGINYSWTPAASLDNAAIANPIASPTQTTTYYVTSVDGQCSSTDSVEVTVQNDPNIVASVNVVADQSTTICAGTVVNFTATATNGGTTPSYNWMINGISQGVTTATFGTSSLADGDVVTVEMISNLACVSGSPAMSNAIAFTVNPQLTPQVSLMASNDSICAGDIVTFTATPTNGGATPTYAWMINGVANGMTGNTISLNSLSNLDEVSVVMTSSEGCVTTSTAVSNSETIHVFNVPLTPSVISGVTTVCEGIVANYSVVNDPNVQSYVWSLPGTWSGTSTTNQIAAQGAASGVIMVQGQNQCGSSPSAALNVTVNSLPIVSAAASSNSVCAGDSVQLTGTGAASYAWNNGVLNGVYFVPSASNQYVVIGTDANGCVNSDTLDVNINALPNISIIGDNQICQGQTTNLIATGGASYVWDNAVTSATNTVSPTLTTSYSVIGTDNNGCSSQASYIVSVESAPNVFIAGNTNVCQGDNVTLTASGAISYTWSNNVSGSTQTITPSSNTTLSVIGTTANGCSASASISINVNTPLVVSIAGDNAICSGESTLLTATGATSYLWSTGETTSSISVSPGATTIYTVTGSSPGACSNTADFAVSVSAPPTVTASADLSICQSASATITASGAATYTWNNGAGSGSSVTVSPINTTTYTVTGTDANGCSSTDQVVVNINPLPNVTASSDVAICAGLSTNLTASGASTYVWDNGAGSGAVVTVSPANATSYTVTGTDANGCSNSDNVIVLVNAQPTVAISGASSTCSGSPVTLSASGAASYVWSGGLGTNASISVSPTSTTTYSVTGTSANGCSSTTTHTVTVNTSPSISAGADLSMCAGSSVTLSATGGTTYSWNNGIGAGNNISVSPTSTTTYTVTSTDVNGCVGTDDVIVQVNAAPTVTASPNVTICAGDVADLSASGATNYTWDNGAGSGVLVSVSPTTSTAYTVTGTNANGCSATAQTVVTVNQAPNITINANTDICVGQSTVLNASGANSYSWDNALGTNASVSVSPSTQTTYTVTGTGLNGCMATESITINVNALPVVSAMPDASVCANGSIALTASGADTYVWNNGAGSGSSVTVSPTATTVYTVTGTSLAGCSNTDEVQITVNALPTVVATADVMICEQETTQLGASGASSYVWDNGAGSGSTVNVSPTGSLLYTVTGTDANGCTAQDVVMVTVNPLPVVSINGDGSVCSGEQASLTASGASTYLWDNGLGTNASVFASPTSTTTYTVEGTDGNGCSASEQFTVSVNAADVSVGINQYTLTALSANATAYQWIDCNNNNIALTGETNDTYTATANGNYAVIVTENGCQDTSACYIIGGIGIDENVLNQIVVYPNPTKGMVYIENVEQTLEYEILSFDGKQVAVGEFKQGDNQIDLSPYANGMYFLKIDTRTIKLNKH